MDWEGHVKAEAFLEETGLLITGRKHPITTEEALIILKETSHDKCCSYLPEKPRGGTVYLFKPQGPESLDGWRHDGYKWKGQGTTRLPRNRTPLIQKKYFYGINKDGSTDHSRRKDVFVRETGTDPDYLALVHYVGEIGKILDNDPEPSTEYIEMEEPVVTGQMVLPVQEPVGVEEAGNQSGTSKEYTTKTSSVESSVPGTPDLAAAMETMKAALAAKQRDSPMMEMFSTLFESVCSNIENPDMDYCLVVSDKKSGKSSLIGTEGGKEIACKTPEIVKKTKGNNTQRAEQRKRKDTVATEDQSGVLNDLDDADVGAPTPTTKRRKTHQSNSSEDRSEKDTEAADKQSEMKNKTEMKSKQTVKDQKSEIETHSKIQQTSLKNKEVIDSGKPTKKIKVTKSKYAYEGNELDPKSLKDSLESNDTSETPARSQGVRSRRNVNTPNWKDVLSGRVSIKDDSVRFKSDSCKRTEKGFRLLDLQENERKVKKENERKEKKDSGCINLVNRTDNVKNIPKKLTPQAIILTKKAGAHMSTLLQSSATDKNSKETQNKVSTIKQCSVKLRAVEEKVKTSGNTKSVAATKVIKKPKIDVDLEKICIKSPKSWMRKSSRKKVASLKLTDFETKSIVNNKHSTDQESNHDIQNETDSVKTIPKSKSCNRDKNKAGNNKSTVGLVHGDSGKKKKSKIQKGKVTLVKKGRGRPKGSRNKTLDDDDGDFEAKEVVLAYTGHSGRPKQISMRVKIEPEEVSGVVKRIKSEPEDPEVEELPKRKSKKSTTFDTVAVDEMKLSDDEDVLEWKGVGESKNIRRGRPKGSGLKKYEIITEPIDTENKETISSEQKEESQEDRTGPGLRASSRISPFLCELCAKQFSLKYLLEEHYQSEHTTENIESSSETESIKECGSRRKHTDSETAVKCKISEFEQPEGVDKDRNTKEDNIEKELDSADEEQEDIDDQDWKVTDDEDENDDYDDDDDFEVKKSMPVRRKKIVIQNKDGDHTCSQCSQKFKSLVSLQVHKIVHMKKDLSFECITCKQKFLTRNELQIHSRTAHKVDYGTLMYFGFVIVDSKIQCEICTKDFESMESYHDHRPNHLTLNFLCRSCGQGFETHDDLETHTQSKCTENKFHLKCDACNETFNNNEARKKHVKAKHAKESKFTCHVCGLSKDDLDSLKEHINNHTNERIFQCENCKKCFSDKRSLLDHRPSHSGSQELECPTCFKVFNSQRGLQLHMHRHTIKKKFPCRFCDQKFESKEASLKHEQIHETQDEIPQEHKCIDCGRIFSNKYRLERHSQVHFEERVFECFFCGEKFQTGSALLAHKKAKHPDEYKIKRPPKVLICEHCGFKTTNKQRLTRHMQTHNAEKLFECEFCGKKFQTLTSCSSHKMIHRGRVREPGKKFICMWASCGKEFIKPAALRRHLNSHLFKVVSGREDCDCQECAIKKTGGAIHGSSVNNLEQIGSEVVLGESCTGGYAKRPAYGDLRKKSNVDDTLLKPKNDSLDILQEAISHIEEAENEADKVNIVNENSGTVIEEISVTKNVSQPKIYPCPWCTSTYTFRCKLVDHFSKLHLKQQFPVCDVCNKVYLDKKNLKEHKTIHSGVKSFHCEDCGKVFRTKTSLRQHSHIHSENKPYVCSYCGHGFTQRGYFTEHVRRHTGERPYSCHVCQKSFVSNDLRKRHMYTHTGNKPHHCSECGKSFIDKSLLVVHLRTHIDYRPFQCGKCDKAFFANAKLQRHLATVHRIDKQTLSDYFPTKINKGLGWRHKNKENKEKIKPDTQYVVYIDQHGNIISRVETRAMEQQTIAPKRKEAIAEENKDTETQTAEEEALEPELEEAEEIAVKQEQEVSQVQNSQMINKAEQSFIPLTGAIEVHTRRDASGQLQIYTVPQTEKKSFQESDAEFVAEEVGDSVSSQEMNEAVEVFHLVAGKTDEDSVEMVQMPANSEVETPTEPIQVNLKSDGVAQVEPQYATIIGDGQSDVQHIELIQAATEQELINHQQEAVEAHVDVPGEEGNVYDNQNIEIQYAQPQVVTDIGNVEQLAQDISINIGEDGTVNVADLEKIEALRNLYSDQQIVIVLENQNQQ